MAQVTREPPRVTREHPRVTREPPRVISFPGEPPRAYTNDRLEKYWKRSVGELCKLEGDDAWTGTPAEKERHRIYACLLMAIVYQYWNGNKNGRNGQYPLNQVPEPSRYVPLDDDPAFLDRDYYGHNIAGLAVDAKGRVVDFDFNHNDLFNSSAEHAEARLVRRIYSLAQIGEAWRTPESQSDPATGDARKELALSLGNTSSPVTAHPSKKKYASLSEVTIYTSLESCAQCSGAMALAAVNQVVYLQTDPGTYWIGRILRNLTAGDLRSPRPISGQEIEFPFFAQLDAAYMDFATKKGRDAFWLSSKQAADPDRSVSITSFLCTAQAREIFGRGGDLRSQKLEHGSFRHVPDTKRDGPGHKCSSTCGLTNTEVLQHARAFLTYARDSGRRGTPHNL